MRPVIRDLIIFFAIALGLSIAVGLLIPHAHASSVNIVQIPSNIPKAQPGNETAVEVHQGGPDEPEIIYQNETADLRLVRGWYDIVQRYPGEEMVDVSSFTRKIFIDPAIFPVGIYYQWSPEGVISSSGNNVAFEVRAGRRPVRNQTYANVTGNQTEVSPSNILPEILPLTPVHMADYYVARGDSFNVTFLNESAQVWVIQARDDGGLGWLPPVIARNQTTVLGEDTGKLQIGANYTILVQNFSQNRVADLMYRNVTRTRSDGHLDDVLVSPFDPKNETIVTGYQPWMVREEFLRRLSEGYWVDQGLGPQNLYDDVITERTLILEDPYATIREINEMSRNATREATLVQVTGYTNLQNNTEIQVVLDYDKTNARTIKEFSWNTTVMGRNIGDKRQFALTIPMYYDQMAPEDHFLTAITPDGIRTTVSFHINDIPDGVEAPLARQRYIGSNPFVPTPTPEIVYQTITITMTPEVKYVYITPSPTPTPTPPPIYTQTPWIYVIVVVSALVLAGVIIWVKWKWYE